MWIPDGDAARACPKGTPLGLRLNPERARAVAGFDYLAIGVPGRERSSYPLPD